MKLFYTPRSHFSGKVRMLLGGLRINTEMIDVGNVADSDVALFGSNPLMKVPTLVDGSRTVFDSDHIAQYLVRHYDATDRFNVLTAEFGVLNARAVINGIMSTEVELILAARTGIDTQAHRRFEKMRASLQSGLDWLENHVDVFPETPNYLGFHLTAMWDHLALYSVCPLDFPRLQKQAERWNVLPYVTSTKPA